MQHLAFLGIGFPTQNELLKNNKNTVNLYKFREPIYSSHQTRRTFRSNRSFRSFCRETNHRGPGRSSQQLALESCVPGLQELGRESLFAHDHLRPLLRPPAERRLGEVSLGVP